MTLSYNELEKKYETLGKEFLDILTEILVSDRNKLDYLILKSQEIKDLCKLPDMIIKVSNFTIRIANMDIEMTNLDPEEKECLGEIVQNYINKEDIIDFSNHPLSIGEIKSDKQQDSSLQSARDCLIGALRDIDSGKLNVESVVIVMEGKEKFLTHSRVNNVGQRIAMLEQAKFMTIQGNLKNDL